MREVQLKWNPETVARSEIKLITDVASMYEVVAHLEVTKVGVRQLVKICFKEGKGPNNLAVSYTHLTLPTTPYV